VTPGLRVSLSIETRVRREEALYALRALLSQCGVELVDGAGAAVRLHYGRSSPPDALPTLWIRASTFFDEYGSPRAAPALPLARLDGLPLLYLAAGSECAVTRSRARLETTADLVASAFYLLSGYEESVDPRRDAHGRFLAEQSFQGRAGLLAEPLVDDYAALLARLLGELAGVPVQPPSWDGHGFALVPSHDVDGVKPRGLGSVLDPILALEAEHGVRSTCFFLASEEDPVKPRYVLEDKHARRALRVARKHECEIGLHGSYWCLDRPGLLETERASLEAAAKEPRGFRQHYLRLPSGALARLERAGFRYDSSLGWPDALGFRNGTARPFRPFDLEARRELRLVEIPLVAMDRTLQKYLQLEAEAAWCALEPVLEALRRAGGCGSVLWHPEFFDGERHPGFGALYARLLGWLRDHGGRALTGKDATHAWKAYRSSCHAAP
jgi:peptidoglycan/xylan/chitin deacetylase (PgdA/CDA1 family)